MKAKETEKVFLIIKFPWEIFLPGNHKNVSWVKNSFDEIKPTQQLDQQKGPTVARHMRTLIESWKPIQGQDLQMSQVEMSLGKINE